jgi:hypothetical protein
MDTIHPWCAHIKNLKDNLKVYVPILLPKHFREPTPRILEYNTNNIFASEDCIHSPMSIDMAYTY